MRHFPLCLYCVDALDPHFLLKKVYSAPPPPSGEEVLPYINYILDMYCVKGYGFLLSCFGMKKDTDFYHFGWEKRKTSTNGCPLLLVTGAKPNRAEHPHEIQIEESPPPTLYSAYHNTFSSEILPGFKNITKYCSCHKLLIEQSC